MLIHAPTPRLLIFFKKIELLPYSWILFRVTPHLLFFLSPDFLTFYHTIIYVILIHSFLYSFSASLSQRANARNVRLHYSYLKCTNRYISISICTLPTQDTTFIYIYIYIYNFVYLVSFCCLGIYQTILSGK